MNKIRAVTLSAVAAATFVGVPSSSSPERVTQTADSQHFQPERPSAARMVTLEQAAACAALGELRGILGTEKPEPLRMFSDGKNVFRAAVFSPEELQEQADKVEAELTFKNGTIRIDQLGVDGLAAATTSRLAADATADVFDQFADYDDPLEAAATIDQTEAIGKITQARDATALALRDNCDYS
jgi:hypothetical protein